MADTDPGVQSFFPWVRRKLATLPRDTLADGVPGVAAVPVELHVHGGPVVQQQFRLYGPADVIGFDQSQVIRTEPPNLSRNYEPNFLVAVEFDRPDFPWMFTPAAPDALEQLRPWICLVVVRKQDGVNVLADRSRPLPVLEIAGPAQASAELPNLSESWAWAHGQVAGEMGTDAIDTIDAQSPARTLSRLLSPRRLAPNTAYIACVVPAFDAGRKAGLGSEITDADQASLKPAWLPTDVSVQLPVYYQWQFETGPSGDFASLVQLLKIYVFPADSGTRQMFVGAAGQDLPAAAPASADAVVGLESAMVPPGMTPAAWNNNFATAFRTALRGLISIPVDGPADPRVGPPFYAGRHANQTTVPLDNATPNWLRQLDLDPRYRAVAAYGKRVVQQQQEALMASAWDQVGEVERANDILRHAQLVRRASQAIYTRHISQLPSGTLLEISRPVHTRVAMAANATVRKVLATNNMPSSVVTRAFTRIARPRGPLMRRMLAPAQRAAQPIATRVAGGLLFVAVAQPAFQLVTPEAVEQRYRAAGGARPAGPPPVNFIQMQVLQMSSIPPRPGFAVTAPQLPGTPLQVIFQLPPPSAADSAQAARFRAAVTAHQQMLGPVFMIFPLPPPTLDLEGTFRPALLSQMNPQSAVARWVRPLITVGGAPAANNDLEPVAAAPQFPQPMYEALRDLSQDVIAPALSGLPDNRVALLQTNPRFVEAFMAGLNHEMARELLWRGYPTDQRGTCFRVFWDRRGTPPTPGVQADGDIPPLHTWPPAKNLGEIASAASSSLVLLMRGEITRRYPNLVVYMVAAQWPAGQPRPRLGTQEVHPIFRGTLEPDIMFFGFPFSREQAVGTGAGSQPGWFFVIAEHPTAPRFGLDPAAPPGAIPPRADAALTGRALLQPPVRLAIHAGDLLRRT